VKWPPPIDVNDDDLMIGVVMRRRRQLRLQLSLPITALAIRSSEHACCSHVTIAHAPSCTISGLQRRCRAISGLPHFGLQLSSRQLLLGSQNIQKQSRLISDQINQSD